MSVDLKTGVMLFEFFRLNNIAQSIMRTAWSYDVTGG